MKRRIELYGRLREAGGSACTIDIPPRASAALVLALLKSHFARHGGAFTGCALATETDVLSPRDRVPLSGRLAALPPVCGG